MGRLIKKIEYRYVVAAIYACVLFLDRLDLTIVNIALPTLATYFKVPITQTEWISTGFLLALAISIPISGWVGDRFGVKKVFIIATIVFGLSSLLCAFSPTLFSMVLLRFLQGLAGGMIIPVGMTMVYRIFDPAEYAGVTSFVFIPSLIAPALAPTLGGLILYFYSWKWIFAFAAPVCLVAVIMSILILKEQDTEDTSSLDWGGFFLSSCSLILLLYFISLLGKQGLTVESSGILLAAIVLIYAFLRHEKNTKFPLINIKFFKNKLFVQANLIQIAFQICHFGSIFLVGMYLQVGIGMSAITAGFIMGMQALGAICTIRYSVKLFHRYGPGVPIISGFIGVAIFTSLILLIDRPNMIFWGASILFVRGLFSGLCGTPIQTASIIGFKKADVSRASAIFNAGRQIAISLGFALSSLFIAYGFKVNKLTFLVSATRIEPRIFYYAFILIPLTCLVGIFITNTIDSKEIILTINNENYDKK